jgi:hypothetical protein
MPDFPKLIYAGIDYHNNKSAKTTSSDNTTMYTYSGYDTSIRLHSVNGAATGYGHIHEISMIDFNNVTSVQSTMSIQLDEGSLAQLSTVGTKYFLNPGESSTWAVIIASGNLFGSTAATITANPDGNRIIEFQ